MSDLAEQSTRKALIVTLLVDISDILMNIVVALITRSSVMLAESMQGLADFISVSLVILGHKRADRRSNTRHPFGYGKELYFWSLISAFFIFSITAWLSFYFGWQHFWHPEPVQHIALAYIVLAIGTATNFYAFNLSAQRILGRRRKMWRAFLGSHNIAPKITYVLDLMGTLSAALGLVALVLYQVTGNSRFDGLGAMLIAVMMAVLAFILLISIKDLITGRSAPPEVRRGIRAAALSHPAVLDIPDLRTMIIGSDKYLVNIDVHLKDGLDTDQIEQVVDEIKANIKAAQPGAYHVQIEPETPDSELKAKNKQDKN